MDELTSRIPEWEREAADHERKAQALRQIIEGVRALNGEAARLFGVSANGSTSARVDAPRGRAAVRQIAAEKPGTWKVSEMKAEIIARGWGDPGTGAEAAMKRLAASGECVKLGHGTYRFGPPGANDLVLSTEAGAEA